MYECLKDTNTISYNDKYKGCVDMTHKQQYSLHTDLAVEAKEMYVEGKEKSKQQIDGIDEQYKQYKGIDVTRTMINAQAAKKIQKEPGCYITIHSENLNQGDTTEQHHIENVLAKEIEWLIHEHNITEEAVGLIVGLGNLRVTPDALGPKTSEKILVTNHLFTLEDYDVTQGYRPVSTIAPGVMGTTGMETMEIIQGIVKEHEPDFLIAIDALRARAVSRLNETIQLSDTGIHPGSGIGNKRKGLSEDTLGIPVFAIGVPTVVDAVTITNDAIENVLRHLGKAWKDQDRPSQSLAPSGFHFGKSKLSEEDKPERKEQQSLLGIFGTLTHEEKQAFIHEVLTPLGANLIVTPKNVDAFMDDMSDILANGLNQALHANITPDNSNAYTK